MTIRANEVFSLTGIYSLFIYSRTLFIRTCRETTSLCMILEFIKNII